MTKSDKKKQKNKKILNFEFTILSFFVLQPMYLRVHTGSTFLEKCSCKKVLYFLFGYLVIIYIISTVWYWVPYNILFFNQYKVSNFFELLLGLPSTALYTFDNSD